ncbi:MAG: peptide chain release factor N(5)-glutamine methyltransferase [Clostridia bacterium]|nr:peptide chain release factor N(5)-glutamine methyltransferase [Clostridia bacterium]
MKNIFIFPVLAGNLCVADNNAVICRVSNKGAITMQTHKLKNSIIPHKDILFLRGLEFIIFSTFYFFWALRKSFISSNEQMVYQNKSPYLTNKYYFGGAMTIFAVLVAVVVLGALPTYLGFWIFSSSFSLFVKKLCIAITKCVVLYGVFLLISLLPSVKMLYKFNTAGNIALNPKEEKHNDKIATNYFNVVFLTLLLSYFVICLLGFNLDLGWKIIVNLIILAVCFSVVFELLLLLDTKWKKHKGLLTPISFLFNSKPTKTELQVANASYNEGILMIENSEREVFDSIKDNGVTFSFVLANVKEKLLSSEITDTKEAEWLIASVLKCSILDLKFVSSITKQQNKDIQKAVEKRKKGEPIAKIFGITEFYGLKFKVNKSVLTPRQETEILVENAIKIISNNKYNVLDLCTGSGAIAVAVAKNTNANVMAIDISEPALVVAKENAKTHSAKIAFKHSDMFSKIKRKTKFDMIISNPPYIKTEEISGLAKEVKDFDPTISLDGGADGFDFYKKIAQEAPNFLTKNGKLLLEVGYNQAGKVKKLLTEKFINIKIIKDYNNIQRVIIAEKK